jgi:hypothetical protein
MGNHTLSQQPRSYTSVTNHIARFGQGSYFWLRTLRHGAAAPLLDTRCVAVDMPKECGDCIFEGAHKPHGH